MAADRTTSADAHESVGHGNDRESMLSVRGAFVVHLST
jgi:hypothetical protein